MQFTLTEDFLIELFKQSLISKRFLDTVIKHLNYEYLPDENYKQLYEKIVQKYDLLNAIPTIGVLSQEFSKNEKVLKLLLKIKQVNVLDKKEELLDSLQKYITNSKFLSLYDRVGNLYNEGKQDKAIKILEKESNEIANFSIRDEYYTNIFKDFELRHLSRQKNADGLNEQKVPFSIHELDHYTRGGISIGTSALFLGRSGTGKSTILRWIGMSAARMGHKVVHFQAEGTEQECLDAYDAGWTSIDLEEIESGALSRNIDKEIHKVNQDIIKGGGEIFVKSSESFDELSINACREILENVEKIHGKISLVIFDYLELFTVKGRYMSSSEGERKRREDIANKITNIATEFKVATITATQANDIRPDKFNDPNFVMTRSDIAEFKGALKPFSYFITINQTSDEYDNAQCRLHCDKFRKYKAGQTISLAQSLNNSRFYDSKRTLELFWNDTTKTKRF